MERIPKQFYTDEFREEAVALVVDGGLTVAETSRRLSISQQTLRNWIKKFRKTGGTSPGGRLTTDLEAEVSKLRKELAEARLEKEILKKAITISIGQCSNLLQRNSRRLLHCLWGPHFVRPLFLVFQTIKDHQELNPGGHCFSFLYGAINKQPVFFSEVVNRVGGGVAPAVLPHHRTNGSVYGGS